MGNRIEKLKDNQYEIVEEISDKIFEILSNYELNNIIQ